MDCGVTLSPSKSSESTIPSGVMDSWKWDVRVWFAQEQEAVEAMEPE